MPGKTHCRFLAIAILAALAVTLAVALPGVSADGDENKDKDQGQDQALPIPDKAELKYPNLGSRLEQMMAQVEEGRASRSGCRGRYRHKPGRTGGGDHPRVRQRGRGG